MGFFGQFFKQQIVRELGVKSKEDVEFENLVKQDGFKHAGKRVAEVLNKQISSKELARQFVVEELDGARTGNDLAREFVENSGFKSYEYVGAINRTRWEGEESELEKIQLFVMGAFLMKISDIDLRAKVSVTVVDEIMKIWKLGKYENT